jgi:alkylhydroperoxidase family enzyme
MDLRDPRTPTSGVIAGVLAGHADVAEQLAMADEAAWQAVDPVLLELCRLRIAMLLGCEAELAHRTPAALAAGLDEEVVAELPAWPGAEHFDARARAALAFTEHFVIDVATMPDELVLAVREHLGPSGLANFVSALLVVEQRVRLRLAWSCLFGTDGVAA